MVGTGLVKHLFTMQIDTVSDLSPMVLIILLAIAAVVRSCAPSSVLRATGSACAQARGR